MKFKKIFSLLIIFISFYIGAPTTNQIVPSNELGNPSTELLISGQILNRRCNPVSNAKVDVWYAGGNPGKYKCL